MKYIAFLRGINIGGHNVKMEDLRALFIELGFKNVRTYIQTGNVFFETEAENDMALQQKIEAHLLEELDYDVPTFVRTIEEVEQVLAIAPFHTIELTPDTRHMILFTSGNMPEDITYPFITPKGGYEFVGATQGAAFVVVHLQNGRFENSNYLEKNFNIKTTSRFFHTTQKILEAANQK